MKTNNTKTTIKTIEIDCDNVINAPLPFTNPIEDECKTIIERVIAAHTFPHEVPSQIELSIRIVSSEEIHELNLSYRGKDKPTNVLSFANPMPIELLSQLDFYHLGDIILCAQVIEDEAIAQQKPPRSHWVHMLVHGCLHLLGYDHVEENDAKIMEALERSILKGMDIRCPYGDLSLDDN